jgi:methionyl-tRNA formyltransferase
MGLPFVYFGYDFMLPAVREALSNGHVLKAIFTFPCDNRFIFNRDTLSLANDLGIPVIQTKPSAGDIEHCITMGAKMFIVAGYPWKIPPIDTEKAYALNIHPSLLPLGRGFMPVPYILLDHPEAGGYTLHVLSSRFDAGDILMQRALTLSPDETVETYSARIALASGQDLLRIMNEPKTIWEKAQKQDESKALHFPPPTDTLRTLDWAGGIARIGEVARAFGRYGCLAPVSGSLWAAYALDIWAERHDYDPGMLIYRQGNCAVIAASDGFVCLKDFESI